MTVVTGIFVAGAVIAMVIAMAGGAAWGRWASHRYTDLLLGWERDARKQQYASLEKQLAQRFEHQVDDIDSRIDALEHGAVRELKGQAKKLTNATATAGRIRRSRDQLQRDNAVLKKQLKQRIRAKSTPTNGHMGTAQ